MVSEKQRKESAPPVVAPENGTEKTMYYLAEVSLPNLGNLKNMFARSLVLHNSITLETKENIKRRKENYGLRHQLMLLGSHFTFPIRQH